MILDALQMFALGLLLLRLLAVFFYGNVIRKQINYFRSTFTEAPRIRRALFFIVIVCTIGQFVPILIDTAALFEWYQRRPVAAIGYWYAFSNATTAAISAFGWNYLYKVFEQDHAKLSVDKAERDEVSRENAEKNTK